VSPRDFGLVLLSAVLHALWGSAIKRSDDPVLFNWLQMAVSIPLAAAVLVASPGLAELDGGFWAWVALALVFHTLYMLWLGSALAVADLSLVYPLARSTPAFLPFAAAGLLGERISMAGGFGIATVVVGMWLVQTRGRPHWQALRQRGAGFAWLTLAATVGYGVTDKAAMTTLDAAAWRAPIPRAVSYFFIVNAGSALLLLPVALRRGRGAVHAQLRREAPRVAAALAASVVGYSLILEALRSAPASYVVAVRQASVLFAVAIGALWFGERPGGARALGALVIVAGVALVGFAG